MTADEEDDYIVAQANEPTVTDENGRVWFAKDRVVARRLDEIIEVEATETDYMDVSPKHAGVRRYRNDTIPGERRR